MLLPLTYSDGCDTITARIESAVSTAMAENKLPEITVNMVHQTLSSKEIDSYKTLVLNALENPAKTGDQDPPAETEHGAGVADMTERLQPMVEAEEKKEAAANAATRFGKSVSLNGFYVHPKTRNSVPIKVKQLSMQALGFTIPTSQSLGIDAFLDIQFVLDNIKRSVIKRQVIVREITADHIRAEFYNPPPYDSDLGFYLLN